MKTVILLALITLSSAALADPYTEAMWAAEDACEAIISGSDYDVPLDRVDDLLDLLTSEQRAKVRVVLGKCGA